MKVVSTDALTKLIQLIKSSFISSSDVEIPTLVDLPTNATLLDYKWTDHILNDIQWLRANTFSWQDGNVYSTAYTHLVNDIAGVSSSTETVAGYTITYYEAVDGHKIVLANMAETVLNIYNATGVAWYFILDTTNERFKLPRINPDRERLLQTISVRGNGKTLGLTNGTVNGGVGLSNQNILYPYTGLYGKNVGDTTVSGVVTANNSYGITTDPDNSGIISDLSSTTSIYAGQKYLYFYVGEFEQDAIVQTAGITSEQLNAKVNIDASNLSSIGKGYVSGLAMPSDEYVDLTWDANPNTKTATVNGWFWVNFTTSTVSQFVAIEVKDKNGNAKFNNISWVPATNGGSMIVPVLKGDSAIFSAGPNQLASVSYFRFIYAEGEI